MAALTDGLAGGAAPTSSTAYYDVSEEGKKPSRSNADTVLFRLAGEPIRTICLGARSR